MGRRWYPGDVCSLIPRMNRFAYSLPLVSRPGIPANLVVLVSIEGNGNERQLLGSMELNTQDFCEEPGTIYGM
jgi:hypothetical protein